MKDVYYDTDSIREIQVDSVVICGDCSGTCAIWVWSTVRSISFCVEIPINACNRCLVMGHRLLRECHTKGSYCTVQCTNRLEKEYAQYKF